MTSIDHETGMGQLVVAARVARAGDSAAFYRAVRRSEYVKLAAGVYIARQTWENMTPDDRHRVRIRATQIALQRDLVFSHFSAAALWRLPIIGAWPTRVEIVEDRASGGRSRIGLLSHGDGRPDTVKIIDGLQITTLARTVVDVARSGRFSSAVAMADHAVATSSRGSTSASAGLILPEDLRSELASHPSNYARAKAAQVIDFADGRSGSPSESLSRVGMHLLGFPPPVLQQAFTDALGEMYVDFWWPECNLIGEFDGRGKYLRDEFLRGRTTADAVLMEKAREDRLRTLGPRMIRWDWDVARSLPRLEQCLRSAGLRLVGPRLSSPR